VDWEGRHTPKQRHFAGGEDSGYFALEAGDAGSNPAGEKFAIAQQVERLRA